MQAEETKTTLDGGVSDLRCLGCGSPIRFEQLGALDPASGAGACFDCEVCGSRNYIRAEPQPGLGTQPRPVVVRLLSGPRE